MESRLDLEFFLSSSFSSRSAGRSRLEGDAAGETSGIVPVGPLTEERFRSSKIGLSGAILMDDLHRL